MGKGLFTIQNNYPGPANVQGDHIKTWKETYNWEKKKKSGAIQILGSFINLGRTVFQSTKSFWNV